MGGYRIFVNTSQIGFRFRFSCGVTRNLRILQPSWPYAWARAAGCGTELRRADSPLNRTVNGKAQKPKRRQASVAGQVAWRCAANKFEQDTSAYACRTGLPHARRWRIPGHAADGGADASPAEQRAAEPLRTGIGMREALPVEGCDVTPTCSTIGLLNVNNK